MNRAWKLGIATVSLMAWLNAPVMGQYPATLELSALDGTDGFTLVSNQNYSRTGYAVSTAGDFNGDGIDDLLIYGKSPSSTSYFAGAVHVVFGTTNTTSSIDLFALNGTNGFSVVGQPYDYVGQSSVSSAGDINGDGFDDIILGGNSRRSNGQFSSGGAFVIFGTNQSLGTELQTSGLDGTNGFLLQGAVSNGRLGQAVSSAGDINGDGYADMLIGAPAESPNGITRAGKTYVLFGTSTAFNATLETSTINGINGFVINGFGSAYEAGASLDNLGDVNGDGRDDIIIGSPFADPVTDREGEAYVIFGQSTFAGDIELSSLSSLQGFKMSGSFAIEQMGRSVAGTGDMNGDGINDFAVGSHVADPGTITDAGRAYVVFGSTSLGSSIVLSSLSGTDGFVINGTATNDQAAKKMSFAGDLNLDGYNDLLIGSPSTFSATNSQGRAFVVFGGSSLGASLNLSSLDGSNGFTINGINANDFVGEGVGFAGDFNGDGNGDIIIGANNFDGSTFPPVGAAYVVFGQSPTMTVTNTAPIAIADNPTTDEDNAVTFDVLNNDSDADNDPLSITAINNIGIASGASTTLPSGAIVTLTISGSLTYDPNNQFESLNTGESASDSFTYTISDGSATATTTVTIDITGVDDVPPNTPPVPMSDNILTDEATAITFDVLSNDVDNEGDPLFIIEINGVMVSGGASLTLSSGAIVSLTMSGSITYNPNGQFDNLNGGQSAMDSFTYTVSDGSVAATTTVTLTITGIDDGLFPTVFELSDLDGTNGFAIKGININYGAGAAVSYLGDVNGDGVNDILIGSPQASPNGDDFIGQAYVVFGQTSAFPVDLELSDLNGTNGFAITGATMGDRAGISVSDAGDVNQDGIADLLVGAYQGDPNGNNGAGEIYVIFGQSSGFAANLDLSTVDGTNGFIINGVAAYDRAGVAVKNVGDVNADGLDDFLIGAFAADVAANGNEGKAYVVFGNSAGFGSAFELSSLNGTNGFVMNGANGFDQTGRTVARAGDLNADGITDMLIGAPNADPFGRNNAGKAYIVFGSNTAFSATLDLSALSGSDGFVVNGLDNYDNLGSSVSTAGDLNGDGIDDIAIAAGGADALGNYNAGEAYVIFGKSSAFSASLSPAALTGSDGFIVNGIDATNDDFGMTVSTAKDFNNDGTDDLLVGALGANANGNAYSGEAYIVFGTSAGFNATLNLSDLDGSNGFTINGAAAGDNLGAAVSSAGDVNADGIPDIIIGAPDGNPSITRNNAGLAYVIFGRSDSPVPVISLTVSPSQTLEDNMASIIYTFTASVTPTAGDLTINFSVSGTATFNDDYNLIDGSNDFNGTTGTVIIPQGQTSVNLEFEVQPDAMVEPDETIIVTIENL